MSIYRALLALLFIGAASTALGQANVPAPEMGTPEQRAACGHDVGRFCKSVKPEGRSFRLSLVPPGPSDKIARYLPPSPSEQRPMNVRGACDQRAVCRSRTISPAGSQPEMGPVIKLCCLSALDAVDGWAGKPAEGRRCKSVTVKA